MIRPRGADRGEDALRSMAAVTLTLEDGSSRRFTVADELYIPDDMLLVRKELARAPSRYAFWAHQAARAERAVQEAEYKREHGIGRLYTHYHAALLEQYGRPLDQTLLQMYVEQDEGTLDLRRQVTECVHQHATLKAIKDAAYNRIFALKELLASAQRANLR